MAALRSSSSADVYLCHLKEDEPFVEFIAAKLEEELLTVWHNDLASGQTKGKALLESKVVLVILSMDAIASKALSDEVSLAYISDKPIFPVTIQDYKTLENALDFSMKLIVAKLNWSFFPVDDSGAFSEKSLPTLVKSITRVLSHGASGTKSPRNSTIEVPSSIIEELTSPTTNPTESPLATVAPAMFNRWRDRVRKSKRERLKDRCDFWAEHFPGRSEVPWKEFREVFLEEYRSRILSEVPEDKLSWVINLIYGDILQLKKSFSKAVYVGFCGGALRLEGDPNRFYHRVMDYAKGKIAIKGVFNMDSTVRLIAINNLSQFQTASVVSVLHGLLTDKDANTRAVAAIAIGKTESEMATSATMPQGCGCTSVDEVLDESLKHIDIKENFIRTRNQRVIKKLIAKLKDDDRMVREAVCLSLGHLKSCDAIPHLVDKWRNDIISNVRAAALTGLKMMDSPEAREAIRVTQVLDGEVEKLKRSMIMRH